MRVDAAPVDGQRILMTGGLGAYLNEKEAAAFRGILEGSVVFKGLPQTVIDRILKQGMILEAKQGDLVFFEHMPGGIGLYLVLEGKVDIFRSNASKGGQDGDAENQIRLNTLKPGQCFGEYSLLDGSSTSASAKAVESSRLFFLPRGQFLKLTEDDPVSCKTIYHNLLLFLIQRLRQKDAELQLKR